MKKLRFNSVMKYLVKLFDNQDKLPATRQELLELFGEWGDDARDRLFVHKLIDWEVDDTIFLTPKGCAVALRVKEEQGLLPEKKPFDNGLSKEENEELIRIWDFYNGYEEGPAKTATNALKFWGVSSGLGLIIPDLDQKLKMVQNTLNAAWNRRPIGAIQIDLPNEDCIHIPCLSGIRKYHTDLLTIHAKLLETARERTKKYLERK